MFNTEYLFSILVAAGSTPVAYVRLGPIGLDDSSNGPRGLLVIALLIMWLW